MLSSSMHYAFILGTHPELSFLEISSVFRARNITPSAFSRHGHIALCETLTPLPHEELMTQLGGTIKIVELLKKPATDDAILDLLFQHLRDDARLVFGFSCYSMERESCSLRDVAFLQKMGKTIKQSLKRQNIPSRFVVSREPALSSVIVEKELLAKKGCDIVVLQSSQGQRLGKTLCVQPWRAFSERDYGRPARDYQSGMLPPKIARMMINIAAPKKNETLLDPFCGSGTILQEASLMNHRNIMGADISAKATAETKKNLAWLNLPIPPLFTTDARNLARVIPLHSINCIVSEGALGPPTPRNINEIRKKLQTFYEELLSVLPRILKPEARVVIAVPAWRNNKTVTITILTLDDAARKYGFRAFHEPLFYGRPRAHVLRHIHFLELSQK